MLILKVLGAAMVSVAVVGGIILIALIAMRVFDKWEEITDENL